MPARKPKTKKPRKPPVKTDAAKVARHFGTRAGNGRTLHAVAIDARSIWARRGKEVFSQIVADQGGLDLQSELSFQTIRRAVGLTLLAERAEVDIAEGKPVEIEKYVATVNAFNRTAGALGLHRKPKDITPSLDQYLAAKAASAPQTVEDADEGEKGADDGE